MESLDIKAYEIFHCCIPSGKSKLGEREAEVLIDYLDQKTEKSINQKTTVFSTKEDLANVKADIIKWMFIFWIGQIGAILAILALFFR